MILAPLARQRFYDNNNNPADRGLLFCYVAGTTTKQTTYLDQAGTSNTNPIVLNYRGECSLWLDTTKTYKFVFAPSWDTDPPTSPFWTVDNVAGGYGGIINSTQIKYDQTPAELAAPVTPTYYYYQPIPLDTRRFNDLGNGTAADTPIQNALSTAALVNAFGTFQNKAMFMPGYHNITSGKTIAVGQTIEGCGAVNTKLEANYASSTGAPMLILTNGPDFTMARMRVEGNAKGSGLLLDNSYGAVINQVHFNSMGHTGVNGAYGYKSTESASLLLGCSWYYYNNAADIAALVDGGSQHIFFGGHFASRSIGIASSTVRASGARAWACDFQAQYPALKIGNGESLWDVLGGYFEGESGQAAMDVISLGNFDGGGGSGQTDLNFVSNIVAGTLVNDMVLHNGGVINFHQNQVGVNVTVDAQTLWFYETGNKMAAGKTITDNAQFTTSERRNESYMASTLNNVEHVRTTDAALGYYEVTFTRARGGYAARTHDAASYLWNRGGNKALAITSSGELVHHLPTSAPTLSVNKDLSLYKVSDAAVRLKMRGDDGVTRSCDLTFS